MSYFITNILNMLISITVLSVSRDEIKNLPGLKDQLNFKQYSGYLEAGNGKHLHYWFVESQRSPTTDPVILWLNGGPGCSSLDGLLDEVGPFRVDKGGMTLSINKYSWNKVANILFLEAPAGVGFSYSDSGNYSTDDDTAAEDNYRALQHFFLKYPQFITNEFYIAGESYAGIYIPTLSVLVLDGSFKINFKGFAIGNGYLDEDKVGTSLIFFARYHGLLDSVDWNSITKNCCKSSASKENCNFLHSDVVECQAMGSAIYMFILMSKINVYNIYDDCHESTENGITRDVIDQRNLRRIFRFTDEDGTTMPCIDSSDPTTYLNRDDVRSAIHIPPDLKKWAICSVKVLSGYEKIRNTMKPQILKLLQSGKVRGIIYNGDVDSMCSALGDEWFADDLGIKITREYQPWMYEGQVAGFVKEYEKLTFATFKGAGHMVPVDKPRQALHMIKTFLNSESL